MIKRIIFCFLELIPVYYLLYIGTTRLRYFIVFSFIIYLLYTIFFRNKIKYEIKVSIIIFIYGLFLFDICYILCRNLEPQKKYLQDGTIRYKKNQKKSFKYHGNLSYYVGNSAKQHNEVTVSIDSNGYRNIESRIDSSNIFIIGDSYGFSMVSDNKTWVTLLSDKIQRPIYNLSITNYSPSQEIVTLKNVIQKYSPPIKMVIWIIYQGNDLNDQTIEDWKLFYKHTIANKYNYIKLYMGTKKYLSFYRQLAYRYNKIDSSIIKKNITTIENHQGNISYISNIEIKSFQISEKKVFQHKNIKSIKKSINTFKELSIEHDFLPIVFFLPCKPFLFKEYFPQPKPNGFISYFKKKCQEKGIPSYDISNDLIQASYKREIYFSNDTHLNDYGNYITAEILNRYIKNHIIFSNQGFIHRREETE